MLCYRARFLAELKVYLSATHGIGWTRRLLAWRGTRKSGKGGKQKCLVEGDKPGCKRQQGGLVKEEWLVEPGLSTPWSLGVKWVPNPNPKLSAYMWGQVQNPCHPVGVNEALSDIDELVKDAQVGHDVVLKATKADWWN